MQQKTILTLCASLAFSVALTNNAEAANWKDVLNAVNNNVNGQPNTTGQALRQGQQAVNAAQAVQPGSLAELLMQRTGVTGAQAQGGAGALFQVAKTAMPADSFAQLEAVGSGYAGNAGSCTCPIATGRFGRAIGFNRGSFGRNGGEFDFGGFRFPAARHVACDGAAIYPGGCRLCQSPW